MASSGSLKGGAMLRSDSEDEAAHAAILKAPEAFLESLAYARSAPRPFAG